MKLIYSYSILTFLVLAIGFCTQIGFDELYEYPESSTSITSGQNNITSSSISSKPIEYLSTSSQSSESIIDTSSSSSVEILDKLPPQVNIGPTLVDETDTTATIVLTASEICYAQIEFSLSQNFLIGSGSRQPASFTSDPAIEHSLTLIGLESGQTYYFRMVMTDEYGNVGYSDEHVFSTLSGGDDSVPPYLVDGPTLVEITDHTATIEWITNERSTQQIEYSTEQSFVVGTGLLKPAADDNQFQYLHSIQLTGLISETVYYYRLVSRDSSNNVFVSGEKSFTTDKNGFPKGWIGTGHGYEFVLGGTSDYGNGDGQFYNPWDIEVDANGYLYISDAYNDRIQKWTMDGAYIGWIGYEQNSDHHIDSFRKGGQCNSNGGNDGQFNYPRGVAIDRLNHYLYICDSDNHRIQKWSLDGEYIGWIGKTTTPGRYHEEGEDGTGFARGDTPTWGTEDKAFYTPFGIDIHEDLGFIYITDYNNHKIQKWTTDGDYIGWIGKTNVADPLYHEKVTLAEDTGFIKGDVSVAESHEDGAFFQPTDIQVDDENGNIYITVGINSHTHPRVQKWTTDGEFIGWIGDGVTSDTWNSGAPATASPLDNGQALDYYFIDPYGISLDSNGNLYVVGSDHKCQKWTTDGEYIGWIGKDSGIPPEHLWFLDTGTSTLGTEDFALYEPRGVCIDNQGNVLITDHYNNRITKW